MMQIMNDHGITIYIKLDPEALKDRLLHAKTERPLIKGKTGEELLEYIHTKLGEREAYYLQATYTVDGLNLGLDSLIEILAQNS
jgi:shikimate kinase